MDRSILHCDCNGFFASVESVLAPSLRDVPMAVCGDERERHGIVLAKNELAKKYGIVTAETVYSAKKKCPGLVICPPHYEAYVDFSKRVNGIYLEYTDLVEPFGIDESWLDVTASRRVFGTGEKIADEIRRRVREEVGITISVGVSFNKTFAKLGSDYKKPDATTVISRENFKSIVHPLPVGDLLFVGKNTARELATVGIRTIGDLASVDPIILERRLGKAAYMLTKYARGEDDSPVTPDSRDSTKSIGNGYTFRHDLMTIDECRTGIDILCEEIGTKLRAREVQCSTVILTIKDSFLHSVQRQRPLSSPTDISEEIAREALSLLKDNWRENYGIRMLTVTVSGLVQNQVQNVQFDLFDDEEERKKNRVKEETMDIIRQKFGGASIVRGSALDNDLGIIKK